MDLLSAYYDPSPHNNDASEFSSNTHELRGSNGRGHDRCAAAVNIDGSTRSTSDDNTVIRNDTNTNGLGTIRCGSGDGTSNNHHRGIATACSAIGRLLDDMQVTAGEVDAAIDRRVAGRSSSPLSSSLPRASPKSKNNNNINASRSPSVSEGGRVSVAAAATAASASSPLDEQRLRVADLRETLQRLLATPPLALSSELLAASPYFGSAGGEEEGRRREGSAEAARRLQFRSQSRSGGGGRFEGNDMHAEEALRARYGDDWDLLESGEKGGGEGGGHRLATISRLLGKSNTWRGEEKEEERRMEGEETLPLPQKASPTPTPPPPPREDEDGYSIDNDPLLGEPSSHPPPPFHRRPLLASPARAAVFGDGGERDREGEGSTPGHGAHHPHRLFPPPPPSPLLATSGSQHQQHQHSFSYAAVVEEEAPRIDSPRGRGFEEERVVDTWDANTAATVGASDSVAAVVGEIAENGLRSGWNGVAASKATPTTPRRALSATASRLRGRKGREDDDDQPPTSIRFCGGVIKLSSPSAPPSPSVVAKSKKVPPSVSTIPNKNNKKKNGPAVLKRNGNGGAIDDGVGGSLNTAKTKGATLSAPPQSSSLPAVAEAVATTSRAHGSSRDEAAAPLRSEPSEFLDPLSPPPLAAAKGAEVEERRFAGERALARARERSQGREEAPSSPRYLLNQQQQQQQQQITTSAPTLADLAFGGGSAATFNEAASGEELVVASAFAAQTAAAPDGDEGEDFGEGITITFVTPIVEAVGMTSTAAHAKPSISYPRDAQPARSNSRGRSTSHDRPPNPQQPRRREDVSEAPQRSSSSTYGNGNSTTSAAAFQKGPRSGNAAGGNSFANGGGGVPRSGSFSRAAITSGPIRSSGGNNDNNSNNHQRESGRGGEAHHQGHRPLPASSSGHSSRAATPLRSGGGGTATATMRRLSAVSSSFSFAGGGSAAPHHGRTSSSFSVSAGARGKPVSQRSSSARHHGHGRAGNGTLAHGGSLFDPRHPRPFRGSGTVPRTPAGGYHNGDLLLTSPNGIFGRGGGGGGSGASSRCATPRRYEGRGRGRVEGEKEEDTASMATTSGRRHIDDAYVHAYAYNGTDDGAGDAEEGEGSSFVAYDDGEEGGHRSLFGGGEEEGAFFGEGEEGDYADDGEEEEEEDEEAFLLAISLDPSRLPDAFARLRRGRAALVRGRAQLNADYKTAKAMLSSIGRREQRLVCRDAELRRREAAVEEAEAAVAAQQTALQRARATDRATADASMRAREVALREAVEREILEEMGLLGGGDDDEGEGVVVAAAAVVGAPTPSSMSVADRLLLGSPTRGHQLAAANALEEREGRDHRGEHRRTAFEEDPMLGSPPSSKTRDDGRSSAAAGALGARAITNPCSMMGPPQQQQQRPTTVAAVAPQSTTSYMPPSNGGGGIADDLDLYLGTATAAAAAASSTAVTAETAKKMAIPSSSASPPPARHNPIQKQKHEAPPSRSSALSLREMIAGGDAAGDYSEAFAYIDDYLDGL